MKNVKHNGCYICKSKDQEILKSTWLKGRTMAIAVCDKCIAKEGRDKTK